MSIQAGLVGLPNVGKSTLFNALTQSSVPAQNYPFCTIEPHIAITEVPDQRSVQLKKLYNSAKIIPATVTFVDIAGLVKGAASGEGLGNQFLSHIREVHLILHVVRCFEDPDIIHAGDTIDPLEDFDIIMAELMLKDIESATKRIERIPGLIKKASKPTEKKELEVELELIQKILTALNQDNIEMVCSLMTSAPVAMLPLLSAKNYLIIANIAETDIDSYHNNKHYQTLIARFGSECVIPVSAKIESELAQLNPEEAQEMMSMLGMKERSLDTIIRQTYKHLGLSTFFTCGPQEIHAWPIKTGTSIRKAAGEIHSDLERGFICAEVFNCRDLFETGSIAKVKELGKMRTEGQDYTVKDGDIINVRFNV